MDVGNRKVVMVFDFEENHERRFLDAIERIMQIFERSKKDNFQPIIIGILFIKRSYSEFKLFFMDARV